MFSFAGATHVDEATGVESYTLLRPPEGHAKCDSGCRRGSCGSLRNIQKSLSLLHLMIVPTAEWRSHRRWSQLLSPYWIAGPSWESRPGGAVISGCGRGVHEARYSCERSWALTGVLTSLYRTAKSIVVCSIQCGLRPLERRPQVLRRR